MDTTRHDRTRGSALYLALLVGFVILGLSSAMLNVSTQVTREVSVNGEQLRRLHLARSGVRRAVLDLEAGGQGNLGAPGAGVAFGGGEFLAVTAANPDGTLTVTAEGWLQNRARTIQAVVVQERGVFSHAIFAGNSSNDPTYSMGFGGLAAQADQINGDIYSGGDIDVTGDASVVGTARAQGTISGIPGDEGVSQPPLDVAGMNYAVNNDVDVASEFAAFSTYQYDNAGGYAWQLPSNKQAHIFRKNPSDRKTEYQSTAKDDYFLEDPYQAVSSDPGQNGSSPFMITLTGGNKPGPNGNDKVYYIDGNLWIHNRRTYSMMIDFVASQPTRVTFVVSGNIYISDNLFYKDPQNDGLALIAIKDGNVSDSGNIYFGDPAFGTLQKMNAFMYAENDFQDNNLDAEGSAQVVLNGIMSAGNHVDINRDYGSQHSKLTVNFDPRVQDQTLDLPGLPPTAGGGSGYRIVSWVELAADQN